MACVYTKQFSKDKYKYIYADLYVNSDRNELVSLKILADKYNEKKLYEFLSQRGDLTVSPEEMTEEEYLKYRPTHYEGSKYALYKNPSVDWIEEYYVEERKF